MKRMPFIIVLSSSLALPIQAQTALTVAHGFSPSHVIAAEGVDPWMSCVSDKDTDVDFTYFPSGQVANTTEMLDALDTGIADLTTIPIGYVSDRMPLNGVSMLPGMGSTAADVIDAYSRAVKDGLLADEFEQNNVVPIWVMALPAYQIVSTVGPMRGVDDFPGEVIRSAGGTMTITIQSLGASPAEIPSSDMYVAMERGTVDATLSALSSIKPYGINELMNAVSRNGEFGSFSVAFSMRKHSYDALSDEAKAVFAECGAKVQASISAFLDQETGDLISEFESAGIEIYEFSEPELSEISALLDRVVDDWAARLNDRGLPADAAIEFYRGLLDD